MWFVVNPQWTVFAVSAASSCTKSSREITGSLFKIYDCGLKFGSIIRRGRKDYGIQSLGVGSWNTVWFGMIRLISEAIVEELSESWMDWNHGPRSAVNITVGESLGSRFGVGFQLFCLFETWSPGWNVPIYLGRQMCFEELKARTWSRCVAWDVWGGNKSISIVNNTMTKDIRGGMIVNNKKRCLTIWFSRLSQSLAKILEARQLSNPLLLILFICLR